MKVKASRVHRLVLALAYGYLALPVLIFFLGWCRWQIGVFCSAVLVCAVWGCIREHRFEPDAVYVFTSVHGSKIAAVILLVLLWTGLSGVGGYVWQNADHPVRNELFALLVEQKWPLVREVDYVSASGTAGTQVRGLVYYTGYWLPAAVVGKLAGLAAGQAAQYLWAVTGILLMYAWICIGRRKLAVWPLTVLILFSGLDALGVLLTCPEGITVFGDVHLEAWAPYYQFSSMTTQLFWVFNQAVPAWLLAALVFYGEKPRNLLFLAFLTILTATFPFVGMLPFVLYFMIRRCAWEPGGLDAGEHVRDLKGLSAQLGQFSERGRNGGYGCGLRDLHIRKQRGAKQSAAVKLRLAAGGCMSCRTGGRGSGSGGADMCGTRPRNAAFQSGSGGVCDPAGMADCQAALCGLAVAAVLLGKPYGVLYAGSRGVPAGSVSGGERPEAVRADGGLAVCDPAGSDREVMRFLYAGVHPGAVSADALVHGRAGRMGLAEAKAETETGLRAGCIAAAWSGNAAA